MVTIPNLSFPSSATSGVNATGSSFSVDGAGGTWNVNLGGNGASASASTAAGISPVMLIGLALVAILVLKK